MYKLDSIEQFLCDDWHLNSFVDLAEETEMAVVEWISKHLFGYLIYRPRSTATSHNAISRQKVTDIHDPIGSGSKHFESLFNNGGFLAINYYGFSTRVVEVAHRSKSWHFSSSDFLAETSFGIFRERVHEVLALPKRDLQHKFALRCRFKPELRKLEKLYFSGVYHVNKPAAIHAIARKSVRVPTDNHVIENGASGNLGRLFFNKLLDDK